MPILKLDYQKLNNDNIFFLCLIFRRFDLNLVLQYLMKKSMNLIKTCIFSAETYIEIPRFIKFLFLFFVTKISVCKNNVEHLKKKMSLNIV